MRTQSIPVLVSKEEKRDTVLFLGAGFSCDAGLPTMAEFGAAAQKDYQGLLKHASRDSAGFRKAAPILVEAAVIFKQFQQFCKASPTLRDSDVDNMETVICIAEAMYEANLESIKLHSQEYAIRELIRHIQLWLWKVFQQYPPLNSMRKDEINTETYDRLFKSLKQLALSQRLAVITTNYDLVFEYLSREKTMPCHYPLAKAESISIGGGIDPFVFLNRGDNDSTKGPLLCKLHGSINYFQDDSNTSILHVANSCGNNKPIGNSGNEYWKDKPGIFALDSIWWIRNKYGNGFTPAIIPPTYAKLTQQKWLRDTWGEALGLLSKAKKIMFIGYSMPDSDGFMRALMHGAMARRAANPDSVVPPKVYVIDPSEVTHERYQRLFHEIYKPLPPMNFSEATKSVIPEILGEQN